MAKTLARMLENVVMEVGAENVVQIITDNAYVAASRILQEKHNTLFWSPCAAHDIDLLLEDIGKLDWVKPVVEEARTITKYIYNHPWVLRLMRDYTKDKELVVKPLVRVLRLVGGDQTPMESLYEAMDRVKEAIRKNYRGESLKFQPLWDIIDRRWSNQLHQPIHVAGYFLNPCYRFSPSYMDPSGEVMEGFSECMQRMVPDIAVRDLIVAEMEVYQNAMGKLFSSALAKRGKHTQTLDAWWRNWGGNVPNLQKLSLRILCQPCNSSSCKCNWSLFESIHTKKRNKLVQKCLNDLVLCIITSSCALRKVMEAATEPLDLDDIEILLAIG